MRPVSKFWVITVLAWTLSFIYMPPTWADPCACKVTSLSASTNFQESGCTLYKELAADCAQISIDPSVVSDGQPKTLALPFVISLKGVSLTGPSLKGKTGPAVTITTDSSFIEAALFQLNGGSALQNLAVTAPGKTAVQSMGSNNTMQDVVVSQSKVGVQHLGSGLNLSGGAIHDNTTGVLVGKEGSGLTIDKAAGATDIYKNSVGLHLLGNINIITLAHIHDNSTGVMMDGQLGMVLRSEFNGNTQAAIKLGAGANGGILPPQLVAVLTDQADPSHYSIVVRAPATVDAVEAFVADASPVSQGKTFLGQGILRTFSKPLAASGSDKVFVTQVTGQGLDQALTLTASGNTAGTSEFSISAAIKEKALETAAPFICDNTEWFLAAVVNGQNPWSTDFDGDGYTNGQEDKNHDCNYPNGFGLGPLTGESDPADKSSVPLFSNFKLPPFNIPNPCADNPELCKQDQDKDGVEDVKDNCPIMANADQKDFDADGIGDACDLDKDNDGLTNDQDKAAGTGDMNADYDDDKYCDGPAWGPIDPVTQKSACTPGDNCPTVKNPTQWDDDEDGIGNDCDKSPWASQGGATALVDSDNDGFYDYTTGNQQADNCPAIADPNQKDTDGDKVGDPCDSDDDNDGLLDVVENSTRYVISGNGPVVYKMLDPLSAQSDATDDKPDGDGIPDGVDKCPVSMFGGAADSCDKIPGSSLVITLNDSANDDCPTVKNLGMKGAGGMDVACDPDMDGDGLKNADEDKQLTHYWEPDSDHFKMPFNMISGFTYDLVKDGKDNCPTNFNPGSPQPDLCHAAAKAADGDNDGVPDAKDNCPVVANTDQADMDGDGIGDTLGCDPDIDGDGIPNDADKCAKFKDPSNVCTGANPGGGKEPPPGGKTPPLPGINGAIQGGGGASCSLVPGAMPSTPFAFMMVLALAALMVARTRRSA